MDTDDYLQPDFDPTSITVPRLRSILVTHNVPYQATAKKPQLVALFEEYIAPRARQLLAERARLHRSSQGIVDARHEPGVVDDDDVNRNVFQVPIDDLPFLQPARVKRRSVSPRKAPHRSTDVRETTESGGHGTTKPSRSTLSGSKNLRLGSEDEHSRSTRRSMRRTVTPQIETEDEEEINGELLADRSTSRVGMSPFSNENPFQGGSSPTVPHHLPAPRTASTARRTTGGGDGAALVAPHLPYNQSMFSIPDRQPTDQAQHSRASGSQLFSELPGRRVDGFVDPQRRIVSRSTQSVHVPVSHLAREFYATTPLNRGGSHSESDDDLEPGEEFTPDEQLQLSQELENNRKLAQTRQKPTSKHAGRQALRSALIALIVALLGAYAAWYRQEKISAGYCGLGKKSGARLVPVSWPMPEWAIPLIEPRCQNCPSHAICYDNLMARCENDFVLQPHPLSLWGLIPLVPTCEPDGTRARRIQAVADKAIEELRERRARWECTGLYDRNGRRETTPGIEASQLRDIVASKRSRKVTAEEFEDLWAAALGEVKARQEVEEVASLDSHPARFPDAILISNSLARIPFLCAVKRSIRLSLARYRFAIGLLVGIITILLYGRHYYRRKAAIRAMVPGLVNTVLDRLAVQQDLGKQGLDDSFLFQPHLRDDVLREIHSLKEREAIWSKVRAFVEQNANVRIGQRESKQGEIGRAWEWVGPSTENSEVHRRRSRRVSNDLVTGVDAVSDTQATIDVPRWQKGDRPYY